MAKYIFPAVFTHMSEDKYGNYYHVTFPDLDGCFTDGDSVEDAMEMATDVLNLCLYDMDPERIPPPTPINDIKKENDSDIVTLVLADTEEYKEVIERENNPIKYARKKAGMNIRQLADFLGAPYRTVQDWNSGKNSPPKWVEKLVIEKIQSAY